jgi:hypothetical protein
MKTLNKFLRIINRLFQAREPGDSVYGWLRTEGYTRESNINRCLRFRS